MAINIEKLQPMILDDARGYRGQLEIVRQLANERRGNFEELPMDLEALFDLDDRMTDFLDERCGTEMRAGWEDGCWGIREVEPEEE